MDFIDAGALGLLLGMILTYIVLTTAKPKDK